MKKSNEELKEIIFGKTSLGMEEEKRIYLKFFKDWQNNHEYIYKRFDLDFNQKILDIGCGYGYNLIHFAPESVGIEAHVKLADFAKKIGLNIISVNAEDTFPEIDGGFDLVWCSDFLVHLVSPYKFLYDCRKVIRTDGRIMIQVPLMSIFDMHRSDCHFYAFNKKSLLYLIEIAGYKIIKTSGFLRHKPYWFNFIFEPLLQLFGGNIWVLAQKQGDAVSNFSRSYLPSWFKK